MDMEIGLWEGLNESVGEHGEPITKATGLGQERFHVPVTDRGPTEGTELGMLTVCRCWSPEKNYGRAPILTSLAPCPGLG